MLWVKAFHLIFMVTWFAGLFYLPRLFVYHAQLSNTPSADYERFCIMERRLYRGIMMPSMILNIIFGLSIFHFNGFSAYAGQGWLHAKLSIIALLVVYHLYCGSMVRRFKHFTNPHSETYYRWFNEVPALALIAIVILAVVRPF